MTQKSMEKAKKNIRKCAIDYRYPGWIKLSES